MNLSVIVVSYNTAELTLQTLDALQKSCALTPDLTYELIVVDNASTDASPELIRTYEPTSKQCTYIPILSKENKGFGAGNNLGLRKATGEYVLLLNSDLIADHVNFEELIDYMDTHPHVGGLTVRCWIWRKTEPSRWKNFSPAPTTWC